MGKVLFLVQHLGQPRCIKRILAIKEAGFEVEVHGFDRGYYSENINMLVENGVIVKQIIPSNGLSKISKLLSYSKLVRYVVNEMSSNDIIYAFGFEMATLTRLLTCSKYVYECADVVAAREHSNLMKWLDNNNIKESCFTVFTSEGFADFFWGEKRNNPDIRDKYILHPNRLSTYFLNQTRPVAQYVSSNKIRFGFAGLLRFLDIYFTFCELIGKEYPYYEFHFWGDADESGKKMVNDIAEKYSNVFYHGKYANPQDLDKVYNSFDVCVAVYNTSSGNVCIAEPNKLYESMYYGKPIVVSKNTFIGKKVEQLGVGQAIESTYDGIKDFLDNLSVEKLNAMISKESGIQTAELVDNSEILCRKLEEVFMLDSKGKN